MPIYEYECVECGVFEEFRALARSGEPAPCPQCGTSSPRYISAPFVAAMPGAVRKAMERNERSAHEPTVKRRSGCGCSGTHTCKPQRSESARAVPTLRQARKPNARPWMLGH